MNRIILVGSIILMSLFSCSKEDDLDQQITPQKLVSPRSNSLCSQYRPDNKSND